MSLGFTYNKPASVVEDNVDASKDLLGLGEGVFNVLGFINVKLDSDELGCRVLSLDVVQNFRLPCCGDYNFAFLQQQLYYISSETGRSTGDYTWLTYQYRKGLWKQL